MTLSFTSNAISGKDFFDDAKYSVHRYYLKNLSQIFKQQQHNVVFTLKTIAKRVLDYAGCRKNVVFLHLSGWVRFAHTAPSRKSAALQASVVDKANTTLKAFTLAEVLMVLGIIGLIADMTIPTLHQNITEKVTVTRLQKTNSTLENAFRMAVAENGSPETWADGNIDEDEAKQNTAVLFLNTISPYMRLTKNCGKDKGCFADAPCKNLQGQIVDYDTINDSKSWAKAQLTDGTSIGFSVAQAHKGEPLCTIDFGDAEVLKNTCGNIIVDINGFSPPNQSGVDLFQFRISRRGVFPRGLKDEKLHPISMYCTKSSAYQWNGDSCAAWVIQKGNMDYRHKDISW